MKDIIKNSKRIKSSKRGLTFSIDDDKNFKIGEKFIYSLNKKTNEIVIKLDKSGSTISKKKSGKRIKSLFDLRSKKVKEFISNADYLDITVNEKDIIIKRVVEVKDNVKENKSLISKAKKVVDNVINFASKRKKINEIVIDRNLLKMVAGYEQLSFDNLFKIETVTSSVNEVSSATAMGSNTISSNTINSAIRKDLQDIISVNSLFSGTGMLDYSFAKEGFNITFASDIEGHLENSYNHNIGKKVFQKCDIYDLDYKDMPKGNILIGGPSCKPFSQANRSTRLEDHPDYLLTMEYLRIAEQGEYDVVMMENVPDLLKTKGEMFLNAIIEKLKNYEITKVVLSDFDDCGGYSTRKRAILIASKIGRIVINPIINMGKTVGEALSKVSEKWCNYNMITKSSVDTVKRMSFIPQGGNWKDIPYEYKTAGMGKASQSNKYRRLALDKPSVTIVNWRKLPLIHPIENRTLSCAEALAISGFEEDFVINLNKNEVEQAICNGVPFHMGTLVAKSIKSALCKFYDIIF